MRRKGLVSFRDFDLGNGHLREVDLGLRNDNLVGDVDLGNGHLREVDLGLGGSELGRRLGDSGLPRHL